MFQRFSWRRSILTLDKLLWIYYRYSCQGLKRSFSKKRKGSSVPPFLPCAMSVLDAEERRFPVAHLTVVQRTVLPMAVISHASPEVRLHRVRASIGKLCAVETLEEVPSITTSNTSRVDRQIAIRHPHGTLLRRRSRLNRIRPLVASSESQAKKQSQEREHLVHQRTFR